MVFVGEGSTVSFAPSEDIMHKQITLYGSWVTAWGTWRTWWPSWLSANCTLSRS